MVLENDDGLEQRLARWHVAPALHVGERAMFVLANLHLLRLQASQPLVKRLVARNLRTNGQGVNEKPDHV